MVARTGLDADRISVGRFLSVDWQSLRFTGERLELCLQLIGPDAATALAQLRDRLSEVEWQLCGHVVADIVIVGETTASDGSIMIEIEALTLTD